MGRHATPYRIGREGSTGGARTIKLPPRTLGRVER